MTGATPGVSIWAWGLFGALVLVMLAIDLGVGSRGARQELTLRSSAWWSAAWIGLALAFGVVVLALLGSEAAVTYYTAYTLEKSLSIDNVFVFVLIFSELDTPKSQQRRVLYWGVLGALISRGILIAGGMYLLDRFHWVLYPFAALIVLAAVRIVFGQNQERKAVVEACSVCNSWVARFIPVTPVLHNGKFLIRRAGRLVATPLLIALVVVETTDLVFALDSIPAVFSVSRSPFLVYTSNVFAMLGLRSLYFLLAGSIEKFRYLRFGLAGILTFVGAKMFLSDVISIPTWASLAAIAFAVTCAVVFSLARTPSRALST